jgi:hypothetical protein
VVAINRIKTPGDHRMRRAYRISKVTDAIEV